MIEIGALIGAGIVFAGRDPAAWRGWLRLPPLAVGFGIYLPMSATLPVVVGAVIGWIYNRSVKSAARRAAGRAGGLGHDRGRKPVRRAQCRADRGLQQDAPLAVVPADFAFRPMPWRIAGFVGLIVVALWLAAAGGRELPHEPRPVRPSARPHHPVRHRDVGALLLLRDARAPGLLPHQDICCCQAMSSMCCSIRR